MNKQVEQLRAEIERQAERFQDTYTDMMRDTLLAFIDSQPEEQPAENLEEAAEKKYPVYWKEYPKDGIARSESFYDTNAQCRDAFIAGAEWQKGQMLEDAVEDLPKWKKSAGVLRYGILEDEHGRYIQHDGYKLYFDDLLKLPKEG